MLNGVKQHKHLPVIIKHRIHMEDKMNQQPKSATTAGLLGIFLGGFGAHDWYLGEKKKGIIHVCMMSGGILVSVVASIILPAALGPFAALQAAGIIAFLTGIAGLAAAASSIWGLVEGIIILSQGDAGLAAKGFTVAAPLPNTQSAAANNYGGVPMNYNMGNAGNNNNAPMNYNIGNNMPTNQGTGNINNNNAPMNYGAGNINDANNASDMGNTGMGNNGGFQTNNVDESMNPMGPQLSNVGPQNSDAAYSVNSNPNNISQDTMISNGPNDVNNA